MPKIKEKIIFTFNIDLKNNPKMGKPNFKISCILATLKDFEK